MAEHPTLVVIRGNSAAGKSSVARELQLAMGRGTANIGQDHFRRVVLREHDVPGGDNIELIASTARHCLAIDYHVILEGIFFSGHYGPMLRSLVAQHRGPAHVFYLDVTLEESLRRHSGRALALEVPASRVRGWYVPTDTLGIDGEVVVDADVSMDAVLRVMRDHVGDVPPRHAPDPARFL
ncbi:AAA family ATPase [Nocardioides sediminis]|uniref:AAA family ATPase n=1 Tax=Nocardioides sediminis TaxID=433648 RepID=UPI000D317E2C|nr:AAA family ATPase [Nocardioides sediminis]